MKAAVLHEFGTTPKYQDFPDPPVGENQILVQVKAVPLENVDRAMAKGTHFASRQFLPTLPAIVGFDGIGMMQDGSLVGFGGIKPPYGAMAENAAISMHVSVPVGVDAVTAAAVPASTITALFPLKWVGKLQEGETVLINGATGFSGKLAVQVAKLLGAGRVVGTGRNEESLRELTELGANAVIDLKRTDDEIKDAFTREAGAGYDVVLDFLWGHPTELLIQTLVPSELGFNAHKTRLVQIGEMAGATISLAADALRTSGLEITGGGSSITPEIIGEATRIAWEWIQGDKVRADIEVVPLHDIERAWERTDIHGKRLVIVP